MLPCGVTMRNALRQLEAGEIDAYAANRQRLHTFIATHSGLRLVPDNFYGVEQSIIVAKGNKALLAQVERLIEEARASGFIAAAIARAGLVGVDVTPPRAAR